MESSCVSLLAKRHSWNTDPLTKPHSMYFLAISIAWFVP